MGPGPHTQQQRAHPLCYYSARSLTPPTQEDTRTAGASAHLNRPDTQVSVPAHGAPPSFTLHYSAKVNSVNQCNPCTVIMAIQKNYEALQNIQM